ncbi:SGNH/GDSL hydrolase family protein [Trinickia sp. Y13]|uniref:SGNH/GDSL hydrolase family protein n=1 Tax=Trinickia sp. Y13 TaxID=2917807 RepID=UPI0024062176|nr:SGNH/GDSL hydrolase family protein [Trinickia sp. Y13]MDG0023308.1 SGNH/GDSL hydrolase family protein [Trinickia sp. Y13]
MEHGKKTRKSTWLRLAQSSIACAAFALLAACGGGGDSSPPASSTPAGGVALQAVSFGDSLSDVGTYAWYAKANFGGGEFTTNPGSIWVEDVAAYYGSSLAPAYSGGFTMATPTAQSGLGYAQGGARVALQPGVGNPVLSTVPITTQIQNYLSAHGSFNGNQLVMIQGGPNDIFTAAAVIAANPASAATEVTAVQNAAIALAGAVGTLLQNGATKVVLVNVPDIGKTPLGLSSSDGGALLTQLSQVFNLTLTTALTQGGIMNKVIYVDAYTFIDNMSANATANGFAVANTGTACNLTKMASSATAYGQANPSVLNGMTPAQFGASLASSLFCSPQMYTTTGADQSYMFADSVHPTTRLHALFAQQVERQIAAAGIGK